MDPVPDEPTPEGKGRGAERAFSVRNYGLNTWGDLFNTRQKLALITFVEKVRQAQEKMREYGMEEDYSKAVSSYLGINLDRLTDKAATLCIWSVTDEYLAHVFGRQALPMTWDYFEFNPMSQSTGDWKTALSYIESPLNYCSKISKFSKNILNISADNLSYENEFLM